MRFTSLFEKMESIVPLRKICSGTTDDNGDLLLNGLTSQDFVISISSGGYYTNSIFNGTYWFAHHADKNGNPLGKRSVTATALYLHYE